MIISVVMRSRIAKQVIHKGAGPKLPYQAVVIRQSAVHRKGRNAIVSQGGVARHAGSGPVPVFVGFWMVDVQAGQDGWQQVANRGGASAAIRLLL